LRQTLTITQIDEDNAAMVAATMVPAAKCNDLIDVAGINLAAIVGAHVSFRLSKSRR
jgi:hypothetical protein